MENQVDDLDASVPEDGNTTQSTPGGTVSLTTKAELSTESADIRGNPEVKDESRKDGEMKRESEKKISTKDADDVDPFTVHVAIQACAHEIERSNSVLPARKRHVPSKFRDYKDPDDLAEDDPGDKDYKPVKVTATGRGRGRPRKVVKLETNEGAKADGESSKTLPPAEDQDEGEAIEIMEVETKLIKSQRGRKRKYLNFTEEELKEKRPHRCKDKDCGQTFVTQNALQRHKLLKHEDPGPKTQSSTQTPSGNISEKNLMCGYCNRLFSQLGNMKAHLRTHKADKPYECDVCKNTFMTAESLKRHKMSHLGIKPFECDICMKKFSSNVALKEHKTLHSDTKPYQCKTCHKNFRQVSVYKRHLLTHSDEKPYACEICSKTFSQATYLRSHMKKHTGARPYKCDLCDKAFAHASDKTRHQKTHSGKRPYQCHICGANFTDPSSCRRHIKEHTDNQNHTCEVCGEYFKRKLSLRTHMARRHGGDAVFSAVQPVIEGAGDGVDQMKLLSDNHIFLFSPSGQPISRFAQILDKDGQKILSEVEQIEGVPEGLLPPGTTILGKGSDTAIEQVLQLSGSGDAPPGELASASHHLPQEADVQGSIQIADLPLQVAYEVIHDDNNQQIVEIQYQNEAVLEQQPGQFTEIQSSQNAEGHGSYIVQQVENDGRTASQDYAPLGIEDASVNKVTSSLEIVKQEHEYAQPLDEDVTVIQPHDEGVEGLQVDQVSSESPGLEGNHQMAVQGSDVHQMAVPENHINPVDTFQGVDAVVGGTCQEVQESNSSGLDMEVVEQAKVEDNHLENNIDDSRTEDATSQMPSATAFSSILDSEITRNFVSNPNFASQEYYNWLSAFTDHCKQLELPLVKATFTDISHVHKTLADIMASPKGILAHKDNFRILMSISHDLNEIIDQHLMCVFKHLEEQDR